MTLEERPFWLSILKAKYFPSSSPMFASASGGSQFWRQLVKVRPIFRSLVKFVVRNGKSTRFWLDWWVGDTTLAAAFPALFSYSDDPEISIFELSVQGWVLDFRRSLSPVELEDWQRLTACFPCSRRKRTPWFGPFPLRGASLLNRLILSLSLVAVR